jgi:hypothetical protein
VTLSDEFLALELECAGIFGTTATLTVPVQVYDTDGTVSETLTTAAVTVDGPVDDSARYQQSGTDQRVTATFYVPASGLALTPATASRITIGSRTWQAHAVTTYPVQGVSTCWRLDCSEVPSG